MLELQNIITRIGVVDVLLIPLVDSYILMILKVLSYQHIDIISWISAERNWLIDKFVFVFICIASGVLTYHLIQRMALKEKKASKRDDGWGKNPPYRLSGRKH